MDCYLLLHLRTLHSQISRRRLSRIPTKPQNSQKFFAIRYYVTMCTCACTHLLSPFPVTIFTGAPNEDSSDAPQLEDKESSDIFQADTPAILRQNSRTSVVRQSTLQRHNSRNSSVRKTARPGDISTSQSSLTEPIQSPTHVSINLN